MIHPFTPVEDQKARWFPAESHPYRHLERQVEAAIEANAESARDLRVLEIGCGRSAPMLRVLKGQYPDVRFVGIELVDFRFDDPAEAVGLELHQGTASSMPEIADASVDLAFSRSVMEHVEDVTGAYRELARVLKPGGRYLFLTPNAWDYASLVARAVPNRWHGRVVAATEGRAAEDVFPTVYGSNRPKTVKRLCDEVGLILEEARFLGQYPAYLQFSRPLFYLGSLYEHLIDRVPGLSGLKGWLFCVVRKP